MSTTTTDRPAAFWLAWQDEEPWATATDAGDTIPAPPPSDVGRYNHVHPSRLPAPRSRPPECSRTDPCMVPPPGSDRRGAAGCVEVVGAAGNRDALLPPPWAPPRPTATTPRRT